MKNKIELGYVVRDVLTGIVGVADHRVAYLNAATRYCIQPRVSPDGTLRESIFADEHQVEYVEPLEQIVKSANEPPVRIGVGQECYDSIKKSGGICTARAVYLNGCARVLIEPRFRFGFKRDGWWEYELNVTPIGEFVPMPAVKTGGPGRLSSRR